MNIHHLRVALDASAGRTPPSEFRVFAAGAVATTKGVFLFDAKAAALVMAAAAEWGNDFPVDYNHGMVDTWPVDPAASGAAAGWFRPELRDGELWAVDVRWTDRAAGHLRAGEYRYVSPTFGVADDGRIEFLVNVALTNLPATKNLPALVPADQRTNPSKKETHPMNEHEQKLVALGLAVTGETDPEKAAGKLRALADKASLADKALADLAALRAESEKAARLAVLDRGVREAKLSPAQRDAIVAGTHALAELSTKGLESYLATAPALAPAGDPKTPAAEAVTTLSADERYVARAFGLTADQMLAGKTRQNGAAQ